MKKRIIAVLCLLALCFCAAACSCGDEIHEMELKANGFVDKNTGVAYSFAPMAYEPTAYEKTVFGKDDFDGSYHKVSFVNGNLTDASDWLYAKDDGIFAYNKKNTLPTFDELKINLVNICSENIVWSAIDSPDEITALIDLFKNGTTCKYDVAPVSRSYNIKFVSEKYPVAYSILYVEYENDHIEYEETASLSDYSYRDGVEYTVEESGGVYTVCYNYGKYFIYDRSKGICRTAGYIHETYME